MTQTNRYTIFGALFGLLFPIISTLLDLYAQQLSFNVQNILQVQSVQPLHWIINTAPLFLGVFARIAGRRQDAITTKVDELTSLNELLGAAYHDRVKAELETKKALAAERQARESEQEEKKALDELSASLKQLFQGIPVGVAAYGHANNVISTNKAFEDFIDGSQETRAALDQEIRGLGKNALAVEVTLELNSTVKYAVLGRIEMVGLKETSHWILLTDLTVKKAKEAQLIQASKLTTLGELAAGTAHELNQPLNHMKLVALNIKKLLLTSPIDTETVIFKLDAMTASVSRAAKIVDHLRTFGRTAPTSMQPVSVGKAVTGALTLLNNVLTQNDIDIDVNIGADLPMILGVESQLEQVFINLISNAVDAISDVNPDERSVSVEGVCQDSHVCVVIRDTGGGMSNVDLAKVFEPFFTTKAEGKGTGLGGSISYGIVSSFGGTISAANWDNGAEFTLVFPALEPS